MYGGYKKANKILTPEEAKVAATECLVICEDIRMRSAQI
jgi:hypothetical protein